MNALEDNDATAPLAWDARVALESLPTLAIRPNNTREHH